MTHPEDAWTSRFAGLARLPADLRADLVRRARVVNVPAGATVFAPGQRAENLLLLLAGTVRVQQCSASGREVFLYRVNAGESCVLTTACMLSHESYRAEGIAETDVRAVMIPRRAFDDLAALSAGFREFIFAAWSERIVELFALIDDMVSGQMDARLARRLLDLAQGDVVYATHQVLGKELGTAREVISRILAEFQRRGWIEQARGEIRLKARAGLERLARSTGER